jgi:hypothetical protein
MSLKFFHILFIVVSAIFFLGFGLWLLLVDALNSMTLDILAALVSFAACGMLALYGRRFLKKFRNVSNV